MWSYPDSAEPLLALYNINKIEKAVRREYRLNPGVAFFSVADGVRVCQVFKSGDPTGEFEVFLDGDDGEETIVRVKL